MSMDSPLNFVGLLLGLFVVLHPFPSTKSLADRTNSICSYTGPCAKNSYWCYPNLDGTKPVCNCHTGFVRSTAAPFGAWNCIDIDECEEGYASCLGTSECVNTPGSYECQCGPGQVYTGFNCTDLDECKTGQHLCSFDTRCENSVGSHRCKCINTSKTVLRSAKTGKYFCERECTSVHGACSYNGVCLGNETDFTCQCRKGYRRSVDGICEHIPDCDRRDPCSVNSEYCTKNGKSHCICKEGFEKDRRVGNNAIACRDINECSDADVCRDSSVCVNTAGGFLCKCSSGYQYIQQRCQRCELGGRCGKNSLYCVRGDLSICVCESGFILNITQGQTIHCKDINECELSPGPCGAGTDCTNEEGTFRCDCKPGFSHQTGDPDSCQDINECNDTESCPGNATCINYHGNYSCVCHDGFERRGHNCEDIDECDNGTVTIFSSCPFNAVCNNLYGSYECLCGEGFSTILNGTACQDIDECGSLHGCDMWAECINHNGSYSCDCMEGFTGNGFFCQDINECIGDNGCDIWALCYNYNGSYSCECLEGFSGNGFHCKDIDECKQSNQCGFQARCRNTNGSFECDCSDGYEGDGLSCTDINECRERNVCKENEDCFNLNGDFECRPAKDSSTKDGETNTEGGDADASRSGSGQLFNSAGVTFIMLLTCVVTRIQRASVNYSN